MAKLLLIGSLTNKKDPRKTGGVTVLFELLLTELRERKVEFFVIDTLKENYLNPLVAYISIIFNLIFRMRQYDYISLQATANSFITIGPVMIFFAKIFHKKTSVRKFAGNFHEIHAKSTGLKRVLIEYVLRNSNVNFFETKYLVDYFQRFNENTFWFPNVRRQVIVPLIPRVYKKRFVFIGTINPEKGIDELCEAVKMLDNEYTIDIYGPIFNKKYSIEYFKMRNISYKGALSSEDVIDTLNSYDVLVLPSYREGYPGIIIEAFSLGIPVITTKLEGIMEMVENGSNGILIDIKNSLELKNAIELIDKEKYLKLSEGALKSFDNFSSSTQTDNFLQRIMFNA